MRDDFPQPQSKRRKWQTLNGQWEFAFGDETAGFNPFGNDAYPLSINVPFAYQCELSGIGDKNVHENVWYRRNFVLSPMLRECKGVVLKFLACDYACTVWLNGRFVLTHEGGYDAFSADVTKYLVLGEQIIVVKVTDSLSKTQPRGKQTWLDRSQRCWYLPTTGIWQSVWLEGNNGDYIENYRISPDPDRLTVTLDLYTAYGNADGISATVISPSREKYTLNCEAIGTAHKLTLDVKRPDPIDGVHLWSPENPVIYGLSITLKKQDEILDEVETYFAFRSVYVKGDKIYLNHKPLTMKLVLDQGYWADGGMTAPDAEAFKRDITLAKKMGFNGARKHQKAEDPYFYYYADMLGFLVWAETPSCYEFSVKSVKALTSAHARLIEKVYNHPSVIAYVPLNESWGTGEILYDKRQKAFAKSLYHLTKAMDDTRLVITNDGWENVEATDVVTVHDYSKYGENFAEKYRAPKDDLYPMWKRLMAFGEHLPDLPVMLSEYGGITVSKDGGWGYSGAEKGEEDFLKRFEKLNENAFSGVFCGGCYTQLTDVEKETNGLLDERHNPKYSVSAIREIMDKFDEKEKIL